MGYLSNLVYVTSEKGADLINGHFNVDFVQSPNGKWRKFVCGYELRYEDYRAPLNRIAVYESDWAKHYDYEETEFHKFVMSDEFPEPVSFGFMGESNEDFYSECNDAYHEKDSCDYPYIDFHVEFDIC